MSDNKKLDVREIDKKYRKKLILSTFEALSDGNHLELVSNHSLAPLYKLFSKEKHGYFDWQEKEDGPEIWKIIIRKTGSLNLTINEIVKNHPLSINVLEKYGIPYYRDGDKRLSEVTKNAAEVHEEIKATRQPIVNPLRTDHWSIGLTVDYIISNHHNYAKNVIPEIDELIDHLVQAHASTHPQLPMIKARFSEFSAELFDHLKDEEEIVFPAFKQLEMEDDPNGLNNSDKYQDAICWMEEDHVLSGSSLKALRQFCNNYVAPEDSSPGFKILFEELKKFESDMHFHMHLENNVLFSKVSSIINRTAQH